MPVVEVGPYRLRYRQLGRQLPAVLLIHGAGASSRSFDALLPLLGRQRKVVALDLPLHGGTPGPALPAARLLEECRDLVADFAERLGLGRFVLAGHSMGGAIAQLFALAHPDRLAALALLATGARLPIASEMFDAVREGLDALPRWLARVAYSPATSRVLAERAARHQATQSSPAAWLADLAACDRFDLRGRLGAIRCPTLVVGGADDRLTPPRVLEALVGELTATRALLHLLDRAGHQLIVERPDRVAGLLLELAGGERSVVHSWPIPC